MLHMTLGPHPTRGRDRAFNEYLALKIRGHWKERGHDVALRLVEETVGRGPNGRVATLSGLRSDMVGGLPRLKSVTGLGPGGPRGGMR